MKLIKLAKSFFKTLNAKKYSVIFIIFVAWVLLTYKSVALLHGIPNGVKYSAFDILADISGTAGITGVLSLNFVIIPSYAIILINLIDFRNKPMFLIRSKNRDTVWKMQAIFIVIFSLLFSIMIILGGYLLSGLITGTFSNNWKMTNSYAFSLIGNSQEWGQISNNFVTSKMLIYTFISNFLGLCASGFLICTLKTILKNIYTYLILVIILFWDGIIGKFSILLKQMVINLNNWVDPRTIIFNDLYLLVFILLCYVLGKEFMSRKDFITKS